MPRNEQSSGRPGRPALSARIGPLLLLAAIVLAAIAGITFALDNPGLAWVGTGPGGSSGGAGRSAGPEESARSVIDHR